MQKGRPWILGWRPFSSKQAENNQKIEKNAASPRRFGVRSNLARAIPCSDHHGASVRMQPRLQVRETKHRCGWLAMLDRPTIAYFPDASQQLGGEARQREETVGLREWMLLMGWGAGCSPGVELHQCLYGSRTGKRA